MDAEAYVLVVDDSPDARAMLTEFVRSLDIPVQEAKDGVEALEHIRKKTPAFVVLDLLMPRMDGFSVLGRLKLDPDKRDIPILVVTGADIEKGVEEDLRNLVLDVVYKSDLNLDRIEGLVKEVFKDKKAKSKK